MNKFIIDLNIIDDSKKSLINITDFKTIEPDFGLPISEKTEAYLTYDQQHIHLAFRCLKSEPKKIKASVSNRDNPGNDNWIAFCLDAFNDEIGAYFFHGQSAGYSIQADRGNSACHYG